MNDLKTNDSDTAAGPMIYRCIIALSKLFSTDLFYQFEEVGWETKLPEIYFNRVSNLLIITNRWNENGKYLISQEQLLNIIFMVSRADHRFSAKIVESDWILPCIEEFVTPKSMIAFVSACFNDALEPDDMIDYVIKSDCRIKPYQNLNHYILSEEAVEKLKFFDQEHILDGLKKKFELKIVSGSHFESHKQRESRIELRVKENKRFLSKNIFSDKNMLDSIAENISSIAKRLVDIYAESIVRLTLKRLKFNYVGSHPSDLIKDTEIRSSFFALIKQYPYLVPHLVFKEISFTGYNILKLPKYVISGLNPLTNKITFIDFLLKILIKVDPVEGLEMLEFIMAPKYIWLSVKEFEMPIDFSDIVILRVIGQALEMIGEEKGHLPILNRPESIETFSIIFGSVAKVMSHMHHGSKDVNAHLLAGCYLLVSRFFELMGLTKNEDLIFLRENHLIWNSMRTLYDCYSSMDHINPLQLFISISQEFESRVNNKEDYIYKNYQDYFPLNQKNPFCYSVATTKFKEECMTSIPYFHNDHKKLLDDFTYDTLRLVSPIYMRQLAYQVRENRDYYNLRKKEVDNLVKHGTKLGGCIPTHFEIDVLKFTTDYELTLQKSFEAMFLERNTKVYEGKNNFELETSFQDVKPVSTKASLTSLMKFMNFENEFVTSYKDLQQNVRKIRKTITKKMQDVIIKNCLDSKYPKKIVIDNEFITKNFNLTLEFEVNLAIALLIDCYPKQTDLSSIPYSDDIYHEFKEIMKCPGDYLNHIGMNRSMRSEEALEINLLDKEPDDFCESLSKLEFPEPKSYTRYPIKRSVFQKTPRIHSDYQKFYPQQQALSDASIECLLNYFFVNYPSGWKRDEFNSFLIDIMINSLNLSRVLDAILFFMQTSEVFTTSNLKIIEEKLHYLDPRNKFVGLRKGSQGIQYYDAFCENAMMFMNELIKHSKSEFLVWQISLFNFSSIPSVKKLKEIFGYEEKIKNVNLVSELFLRSLVSSSHDPLSLKRNFAIVKKICSYDRPIALQNEEVTIITPNDFNDLMDIFESKWSNTQLKSGITEILESIIDNIYLGVNLCPDIIQLLGKKILRMSDKIMELHHLHTEELLDKTLTDKILANLDSKYYKDICIIENLFRMLSGILLRACYVFDKSQAGHFLNNEELLRIEESLESLGTLINEEQFSRLIIATFELSDFFYDKYLFKKISSYQTPRELFKIIVYFWSLIVLKQRFFLSDNHFEPFIYENLREMKFGGKDKPKIERLFALFIHKYRDILTDCYKSNDPRLLEPLIFLSDRYPWIVSTSVKLQQIRDNTGNYKGAADYKLIIENSTFVEGFIDYLKDTISPEFLFDDYYAQLSTKSNLNVMINAFLSRDSGFFQFNPESKTIDLSLNSIIFPLHLKSLEFLGRLLAYALLENVRFDHKLSRNFIKKLLKRTIAISDLTEQDYAIVEKFKRLLIKPIEGDTENYFIYHHQLLDKIITRNLVDCGQKIKVNEDNKEVFIRKTLEARLTNELVFEYQALSKGFWNVLPQDYLFKLCPLELAALYAKNPEINFKVLMEKMKCVDIHDGDDSVEIFWEVIALLDQQDVALLSCCIKNLEESKEWILRKGDIIDKGKIQFQKELREIVIPSKFTREELHLMVLEKLYDPVDTFIQD